MVNRQVVGGRDSRTAEYRQSVGRVGHPSEPRRHSADQFAAFEAGFNGWPLKVKGLMLHSSGAAVFDGPCDFSVNDWSVFLRLAGDDPAALASLVMTFGFSSTEKVMLEPEEIKADTPQEFVGLLRLVLKRSGMNAGQIAAKTRIGRSSAYSLVAANRTGLPRLPEQVLEFLCGCGLQPAQAGKLMQLWIRLENHRRLGTPVQASPKPKPITQLSPKEIAQEIVGRGGPRLQDVPVQDIGRELRRLRTLPPILIGLALLLGWRFAVSAHLMPGLGVLTTWPCLLGTEMLIILATLRWRLRRPACESAHEPQADLTAGEPIQEAEPKHEENWRVRPLQIEAERRRNNPDARDLAERLNAFYAA